MLTPLDKVTLREQELCHTQLCNPNNQSEAFCLIKINQMGVMLRKKDLGGGSSGRMPA
jgi:hypothetical protein